MSDEPRISSLVEQLDKITRKKWIVCIGLLVVYVFFGILLEDLGHFSHFGGFIFVVVAGGPMAAYFDMKYEEEKENLIKEADQSASKQECQECGKETHEVSYKFCPFCGGHIPPDFVFCPNCGRDV